MEGYETFVPCVFVDWLQWAISNFTETCVLFRKEVDETSLTE